MYCHGSKLHALAFSRPGHLLFPESLIVTPASENDLNVQKQYWSNFYDRTFYGDKIYNDIDFFNKMTCSYNSRMMIPIKAVKGLALMISQIDKAANDLYSTAVSKIRQPIEALFNWLIEKTDIQRVSKVRSTSGLVVHIFGRIAAAYIFLIFNYSFALILIRYIGNMSNQILFYYGCKYNIPVLYRSMITLEVDWTRCKNI